MGLVMDRVRRRGTRAGTVCHQPTIRHQRSAALVVLAAVASLLPGARVTAQDRALFINEIIADNGEVDPVDLAGGTPDMVEIYNASDVPITLGHEEDAESYYLSDTLEFCHPADAECLPEDRAWRFPEVDSTIEPGGSIVVFCDGDRVEALCEMHATFEINSAGREPITLWGPKDSGTGERPVVDQVWLPPLRRNVSFGRFPDGAGPAPVPVGDTFDHFFFNVMDSDSPPTFGSCSVTGTCFGTDRRLCEGAENGAGVNLEPRVTRIDHTTNSPAVDQDVVFTVRVRDDKAPSSGNIAGVEIRYRVDGGEGFGEVRTVEMTYDLVTGVMPDLGDLEPCDPVEPGCDFPERPLDRWSLWTGTIPGQAAGARVEFHFHVVDREGLSATSPRPLCEDLFPELDVTGPCHRRFGGNFTGAENCQRDLADVTCGELQANLEGDGGGAGGDDDDDDDDDGGGGDKPVQGERFIACDSWLSYAVGYEPRGNLVNLVVNEVVVLQESLLADPTHRDCTAADLCFDPDDTGNDPECCKKVEDFIELHNSGAERIELAGLWLSDRIFRPRRGWQFPEGSKIEAGEYLIVWTDNDGAQCPDEFRPDPPCFWECPDPTNPEMQYYHTNFNLDSSGDQIFIFDNGENDFGLIHGLDYARERLVFQPEDFDKSLSLTPDGDRNGAFVVTENPTPGEPNSVGVARFRRGDVVATDCRVNVSDAVAILNYLFISGVVPDCLDAADTDDSGDIVLTDAVRILNYLFLGGEPPEDPGPLTAGPDPTGDDLPDCVYPETCL